MIHNDFLLGYGILILNGSIYAFIINTWISYSSVASNHKVNPTFNADYGGNFDLNFRGKGAVWYSTSSHYQIKTIIVLGTHSGGGEAMANHAERSLRPALFIN